MRVYITSLILLLTVVFSPAVLAQQADEAAGPDSIDTDVLWVMEQDSLLVAGAGTSRGVVPGSRAVVCVPFFYRGEPYRNRVARGLVVSSTDSTCQVRLTAATAPVRPGYRVLLYRLRLPVIPPLAGTEPKPAAAPFYKKKWFWPMVGTAVAATIILSTRGGREAPTQGTVSISGSLP